MNSIYSVSSRKNKNKTCIAQGGENMNKLATLIAKGEITVEELVSAKELIERAELVTNGIKACRKTLMFPFGVSEINCYSYTDSAGE